MIEIIRGNIKEPGSLRMRNKPGAPCVMQYSVDGGQTWRDGWDLSCLQGVAVSVWQVTVGPSVQVAYDDAVRRWRDVDGDVAAYAPDVVYADGGDDDDDNRYRDAAMCAAARDLVDLFAEAELSRRKQAATVGQLTSAALSIVSALIGAGIIFGTAGAGTAVAFGVASAITGAAATVIGDVSEAVLTDEDAREQVANCLYCALRGGTPTSERIAAALDGCDFSFGSPAAQLAGAIAPHLSDDGVKATWIDQVVANLPAARLGLLPSCACDDGVWVSWAGASIADHWPIAYGYGAPSATGIAAVEYNPGFWAVVVSHPSVRARRVVVRIAGIDAAAILTVRAGYDVYATGRYVTPAAVSSNAIVFDTSLVQGGEILLDVGSGPFTLTDIWLLASSVEDGTPEGGPPPWMPTS